MRLVGALVVFAVALAAGVPAFAEHEVYYRYTLLGYVKDAKGQPMVGAPVEAIRDKTGLPYIGETDASGLYVLVLRLGDESLGESLTLDLAGVRSQVTVRFDATNQEDERGTRVDLEGNRVVQRPAWFHSTLTRVLAPAAR
jgi:hypothetical protein